MTQPVSGGGSPYPYQNHSKKKTENAAMLIMEIEDILQQKLDKGKISVPEFIQLSKRLEAIQEQYKANEKNEAKANEQAVKALNELKNDIQTVSGGGGGEESVEK